MADRASAKVSIPSQESTAGNRGGSSYASGAAYGMEGVPHPLCEERWVLCRWCAKRSPAPHVRAGIKKRGITAGERKKLLAAIQRVTAPIVGVPKE